MLVRQDFCVCLNNVSGECNGLFDCFWLSVPVQLIACKELSPK